jgi:UDP-glucose 4-epimerase
MHVLLTGASGWLGHFLAPQLRAGGHRVTGLDAAAGADTEVLGSIADEALVERLFHTHRFDGVIHAAALHKPDIERHQARAFVDVNVAGTSTLLEAAARHGVPRFVFTSTTSLMITDGIRRE